MLRSVAATVSFLSLVGLSFALTFTPLYAVPGDTEIRTVVCDGSASATLTINTPPSDSVIQSMPFTISGDAQNVTQIDITIDGNYSGTIPFSANQTSFSTQLTIGEGTHTIILTGNDVCQVQNPSDTVVLTFSPTTPGQPNNPPSTPPFIGPVTPGRTTPVAGQPVDSSGEGVSDLPVIGPVVDVAKDFAQALDFDATAEDGGFWATVARFSLFTLGLGLLLFAGSVLAATRRWQLRDWAVFQYLGGTSTDDPRLHDHIVRNSILLRLLGLICIVVAFVI